MKIYTIGLDANGRSAVGMIDVPLTTIGETEAVSEKKPGTIIYITELQTTDRPSSYTVPDSGFEQHTGGLAHIVITLAGYMNSTLQDGSALRSAPGDMHFTRTMALHNANINSSVGYRRMVLYTGGTSTDIAALTFKK